MFNGASEYIHQGDMHFMSMSKEILTYLMCIIFIGVTKDQKDKTCLVGESSHDYLA